MIQYEKLTFIASEIKDLAQALPLPAEGKFRVFLQKVGSDEPTLVESLSATSTGFNLGLSSSGLDTFNVVIGEGDTIFLRAGVALSVRVLVVSELAQVVGPTSATFQY